MNGLREKAFLDWFKDGPIFDFARPACNEPVPELGPARADPITGGVRRRKAAGYDPDEEIDHLRLDRAARLQFHNLLGCYWPRGIFRKNHVRPFCVGFLTAPKKPARQIPQ